MNLALVEASKSNTDDFFCNSTALLVPGELIR
jgi:hypothetical protein